METRFILDDRHLGLGSALVLRNAWWTAEVELNGVSVGEVAWSPGEVEVPVGELLRPGENILSISLYGPTRGGAWDPGRDPSLILARSPSSRPGLGEDPYLRIRPLTHVERVELPMDGDRVAPTVRVLGAPAGSTAHLEVRLDGRRIMAWDDVPIEAGHASFPARRWRGPRWDPTQKGGTGLVLAVARVRGPDGSVLDVMGERTAVRDMTFEDGRLLLNGRPAPLLAIRARVEDPFAASTTAALETGANSLEVHGFSPGEPLADALDELGIGLVYMPRCDGQLWDRRREKEPAPFETWRQTLSYQDQGLLSFWANHPALLLWACEGSPEQASNLCSVLRADPLARPVVGGQIVGTVLGSPMAADYRPSPRSWVLEVTAAGETPIEQRVFDLFASEGQGVGGVMALPPGSPGPENAQRLMDWRAAWSKVHEKLDSEPWAPLRRRGMSRVEVTGLEAGEVAWIEAPWATPAGVVSSGRALTLEAWHQGEARVTLPARAVDVQIQPDEWDGLKKIPHALALAR